MLLILLAAPAWSHAAPTPVQMSACPARMMDQPLRNGQVMLGTPQDMGVLTGDSVPRPGLAINVIWRAGRVFRKGELLSLECEYAQIGKAYVTMSRPVDVCRYTQRGARVRLWCR